jgi:hypothetical protein
MLSDAHLHLSNEGAAGYRAKATTHGSFRPGRMPELPRCWIDAQQRSSPELFVAALLRLGR